MAQINMENKIVSSYITQIAKGPFQGATDLALATWECTLSTYTHVPTQTEEGVKPGQDRESNRDGRSLTCWYHKTL